MTIDSDAIASVKACCADLYASDWITLLLGSDSLHPGGLPLTERLGTLLGLAPASRVLDVATGRGTSALHLARVFGCSVVGLDLNAASVASARDAAAEAGLADRVAFDVGDAECLDRLADNSFDAVICECAYCTFPDKPSAAHEIARVLRPGGRFGLSDVTRSGPLPPELEGVLAWVACVGDALPIEGYTDFCAAAGLRVERVEPRNEALAELVHVVRGRLLMADVLAQLGRLASPLVASDGDRRRITSVARSAARAVESGRLGYTLLVARKDDGHL